MINRLLRKEGKLKKAKKETCTEYKGKQSGTKKTRKIKKKKEKEVRVKVREAQRKLQKTQQ